MIIAFTIGHTKSYEQALSNDPDHAFKLGASDNYEGGWIWKTMEEAKEFINSKQFLNIDWGDGKPRDPKKFSVFKVYLVNGWKDVSLIPDKYNVFNLLIDSRFSK